MTTHLHYAPNARRGFTLVELMVVIVIVSILSALTLSGLGVARQRSKADVTASTIRKINEPIMEQYDSYSARMIGSGTTALKAVRRIIVEEMPDSWSDVFAVGSCTTGPGRAYARYKQVSLSDPTKLTDNASAECLYMIVTRSGYEPSALESFRPTEVGDTDGDGLKEFTDAWGKPILFLRWAPGFSSPYSQIQIANAATSHDPLDAMDADLNGYALYPLIVSRGPDGLVGLNDIVSGGWSQYFTSPGLGSIVDLANSRINPLPGSISTSEPTAYRDNVTNHDAPRR